jgi:hypothetical protein
MVCSGCVDYLDRRSGRRGGRRAVPVGSRRRPTRTGRGRRRGSGTPWVYAAATAAGKGCWGSERLGRIFERPRGAECRAMPKRRSGPTCVRRDSGWLFRSALVILLLYFFLISSRYFTPRFRNKRQTLGRGSFFRKHMHPLFFLNAFFIYLTI